MGTTYYCDSAGSNTSPYDTWAKAATSLQTLLDTVAAGDTVFARGTQLISAAFDVDTTTGSVDLPIKIVGCAADGSVDGTRLIVDAQDNAIDCFTFAVGMSYYYFINIEAKQAGSDGFSLEADSDANIFINCISHDHAGSGWSGGNVTDFCTFVRCAAYNNAAHGWNGMDNGHILFACAAYDNTESGFYDFDIYNVFLGCIAHDNGASGDYGFDIDNFGLLYNCIANGEVVGLNIHSDFMTVLASRFTNCGTGIDFSDEHTLLGWNLFHNNTADMANPAAIGGYEDATYANAIPYDADADTNEIDPDVDDGYNASGSDDLNLKASRTYNGDGSTVVKMNIGS